MRLSSALLMNLSWWNGNVPVIIIYNIPTSQDEAVLFRCFAMNYTGCQLSNELILNMTPFPAKRWIDLHLPVWRRYSFLYRLIQLCVETDKLIKFVKVGEIWSFTKLINRSIVQGSGIGPTLFIICIADLRHTGSTNHITKYADDSSLLVPENHDVGLYDELQNVLKWAEVNKMQVNMSKLFFIGQTPEMYYCHLNCLV